MTRYFITFSVSKYTGALGLDVAVTQINTATEIYQNIFEALYQELLKKNAIDVQMKNLIQITGIYKL